MRPILVLMLSLSGILGALGFPMLFTGTYLLGGSMALLSLSLAGYAIHSGNKEAERQRMYDLDYRERIDAFTAEVLAHTDVEVTT